MIFAPKMPKALNMSEMRAGGESGPTFENCGLFHAQSPDTGRGVHARSWRGYPRAQRDVEVRRLFFGFLWFRSRVYLLALSLDGPYGGGGGKRTGGSFSPLLLCSSLNGQQHSPRPKAHAKAPNSYARLLCWARKRGNQEEFRFLPANLGPSRPMLTPCSRP